MNIIDKEDILNMISVNKKVDNNDYLISSIEYLDEKIFDFAKYPKFLQISQSSPFDKLYLEYNKNTSDYLFSWQSLRMLNDVTSSLGAVPSNFMSNYDGIFDFVVGGYDSDKRYYDILCTIINNDKSCEETIDFSIAYETITFLSDTGLLNTIVNGNDVLTFIISSVSDCMKATERTVNLIRCSEYQDNVLDKTILNSYNLKKEMMDDKIITDIVNFSIFNKYINNTYLASLYNNQYALYESANKLNKDIDNPIKNVSTEWYRDMIYKIITSIADEGLNVVSGGATEIPDILMKNIKYNNAINNLILEPSEALNNVKDCYFIQETVKNVCNVDIFNETENSYYNFKLMLQSSLTAYEILKENDTLMKIVGEDGQNLILEKINNINSILNNIVNCDITFYSTSDISNDMVNIKDISIMIVPIENETNSTEMVEITELATTPTESIITAVDLIDKTIPEIIDMMNGEYQIIKTESDIYNYIQNQSVFPGMEFYIQVSGDDIISANNGEEIHSNKLEAKLESGELTLDGIQVNKSGKVSKTIQTDMDYKSCSKALGDFNCIGGTGGYLGGDVSSVSYDYNDNNAKVILNFNIPEEIYKDLSLGKISCVSSEQMKSYNPKLKNIVIRKSETNTGNNNS